MKQMKKLLTGKRGTLILAGVACLLLASSAVGSTRAALTYFSENYTMQMQIYDIGVTLVEQSAQGSKDVSSRDYTGSNDSWKESTGALLSDMLKETGDKLEIGRDYTEQLSVRNSGTIEEYVRVRVFKNWTDADGTKVTTLAPSLIVLNLTQNGWIVDQKASTEERTVLYWPKPLKAGESTAPFSDTLRIDSAVAKKVTKNETVSGDYSTVTTDYNYNGKKFNLEVEVDAVQTHNAEDAIKSAWGVNVNVAADGTLSLAQ